MRGISMRTYALTTMAVAAVVVPATLFAWGPASRVTFTEAKPAEYVTFNSITNNKVYGDERNFVHVRDVSSNAAYTDNITLTPGKEYEVFAYYHNNASTRLNDAAHNNAGIATGAFMRTQMPATVAAGQEARITSFVGASNAKHLDSAGKNLGNQVWDEAFAKNSTNGALALNYVAGSAKITSKGAVNGKTLPDTLFTNGTALGYNALDGKLPGCEEFSGYVTYRFKVNQPNFTVQKQVLTAGTGTYSEKVAVKAGDTVDFRIEYKNTGTMQQDKVVIRDKLPAGMTYVAGSTKYAGSSTNGQYTEVKDETVTKQGIGIGSYAPNGNAFVKFSAKIASADALKCGMNTLTNTASADTENGSKSDTAVVVVEKKCDTPKDIQVCRLSDKKIVTIKENEFDSKKYSKNLDDCKTVVVKDIEVCRLSDKKVVTIKENEFDSKKYSKDLNDCKETPAPETIEVCRLSDKTFPVTIKESEFDSTKHSKDANDCKTTPTTPETPETPETPTTTPVELPKTGLAEGISGIAGIGSLVAASSYYVASRRATKN